MSSPDLTAGLDPGIRDLVAAFLRAGIKTTDSGDGSKFREMEGALDCEHVAFVSQGWITCSNVLGVLLEERPDELWQVEHTVSGTTDRAVPVSTGIAYRLSPPRNPSGSAPSAD